MRLDEIVFTKIVRVTKINRKTNARMFKDCKVGDILTLDVAFKSVGYGDHGTHASYIRIKNMRVCSETFISFNQTANLADILELEIV